MTRLNGTHFDWFRFWHQLQSETDRSELSAVYKFSYPKELISSEARIIIVDEGYTRAKNILIRKHGKPSKVVNAHF